MEVVAQGVVLHRQSAKVILEGDTQKLEIVSTMQETEDGRLTVVVAYPDGNERHHLASNIDDLTIRVSQHLKARYNLESFKFTHLPDMLKAGETIQVGEIIYVS